MPTAMFSGLPNDFPILKKDAWSIIFPPQMGISERFQVRAARPKISNEVKEIKYKNATFKYRGPVKYGNLSIEFRDVVGPAVMAKFMEWQRLHYDPKTGCSGYPAQYKRDIVLLLEDDCGNPVEKWVYKGCFIADLDGGELDMENNGDIVTVKLELAYDVAEKEY